MKKNSILIELTPLLDVILIMLFFILVQSEGRMGVFYDETREAFEAERAIIEAQLDDFKAEHAQEMDRLRGISEDYNALRFGLEEDTGIILISIVADADDPNIRSIVIEANCDITTIDLNWSAPARDAAALELNTVLANKIRNSGNSIIVIAFRFDSASIFMADHRLVENAILIQRQFNQIIAMQLNLRL